MSRPFPKTPTGYLGAADGARKLKAKRLETKRPVRKPKRTTRPGK